MRIVGAHQKRVCVLRSAKKAPCWKGSIQGEIPAPWLPDHQVDTVWIHKASASRQVEALAGARYDVVINLCDGAWHDDIARFEVVQALERLGLPFTGACPGCTP